MPTSGRLRITSIRLPIHIEAIRPQNSSGLLVITCGPGWMLCMIMAPRISAMVGAAGNSERQRRDERGLRGGVVGRFRAGNAFDRTLAHLVAVARDLLFQAVGHEGGDGRTGAGQDAENGADAGAAQDRRRHAAEIVAVRHQPADVLGVGLPLLLVFQAARPPRRRRTRRPR